MSAEAFIFEKPVGVLAKTGQDYHRDVEITIHFAQNGYKIRCNDKSFVATSVDEAIGIVKEKMEELHKEMKKADK